MKKFAIGLIAGVLIGAISFSYATPQEQPKTPITTDEITLRGEKVLNESEVRHMIFQMLVDAGYEGGS
jgi:hypothetical protein